MPLTRLELSSSNVCAILLVKTISIGSAESLKLLFQSVFVFIGGGVEGLVSWTTTKIEEET